MFGKGRNDGLPMASYSQSSHDGSGKSIRMEAPLARSIRLASWMTKAAYMLILVSLFMLYWGYRNLHHSNASIWLTCHSQQCELEIFPPGNKKKCHVVFGREQLVKSQAIKVKRNGEFVNIDSGSIAPRVPKKKGMPTLSRSYNGPDVNGHYNDFTIIIRPPEDDKKPTDEDAEWFEKELTALAPFSSKEDSSGNYVLRMRQYSLYKESSHHTRTLVTRIESYIKQRRHRLSIKENSPVSWQGLVAMLVGTFALLAGIMLGQFSAENEELKAIKKRNLRAPMPRTTQPSRGPVRNYASSSSAPPKGKNY